MNDRAGDPRLLAYLTDRLDVARRRGRRRVIWGLTCATLMTTAGSFAREAVRDPEGVVEMFPVHTGRHVQAGVVRSLEAGAPSTARATRRQLDRVPSEINAVVLRELSGWSDRSADALIDRTAEHLGALAHERPEALGHALGLASGEAPGPEKATKARIRGLMISHLRPRLIDEIEPLPEGPTAYIVATANAVEALDDDAASAEQLVERMVLRLLTQLIAPA